MYKLLAEFQLDKQLIYTLAGFVQLLRHIQHSVGFTINWFAPWVIFLGNLQMHQSNNLAALDPELAVAASAASYVSV